MANQQQQQPLDFDGLKNKYQEEQQKRHNDLARYKPTILLVGRTGVGKSSLVNMVFGADVARVGAGRPVTAHYQVYDSEESLVTLYDSKGWEGGAEGERLFRAESDRFLHGNATSAIDIVWYVVDAPSARFTDFDSELIQEVFAHLPVLVILSKIDIARQEQIQALHQVIKAANLSNVKGVVNVSASPQALRGRNAPARAGLEEVVAKTEDVLPEKRKETFVAAQRVDLDKKDAYARRIILATTGSAFAVGFTPIPFSDAVLLAPLQIGMIVKIESIYRTQINYTKTVAGFVSGVLATNVGRSAAGQLLKMIPGVGTLAGGTITGTVAATITAALGFTFRRLFREVLKLQEQGKGQMVTDEWIGEFLESTFTAILGQLKDRKNIEDFEDTPA